MGGGPQCMYLDSRNQITTRFMLMSIRFLELLQCLKSRLCHQSLSHNRDKKNRFRSREKDVNESGTKDGHRILPWKMF